jgi:hypothetical protein
MQRARARIEGVGHDLGHDRLLEGAGIGVPDVLQEVLQIDACLAQGSVVVTGLEEVDPVITHEVNDTVLLRQSA